MNNEQQVLIESFKQAHPKKYNKPETIYEALQFLSKTESLNESTSIEEESTVKLYRNFAINKKEQKIALFPYFKFPFFILFLRILQPTHRISKAVAHHPCLLHEGPETPTNAECQIFVFHSYIPCGENTFLHLQ